MAPCYKSSGPTSLLRLHTWSWMLWLDLFEHSYMAIILKKSYRYLHSIFLKKGFYLPQSFIFLNVTSAIFNILWFQWSCNNRKKGHNDNTNLSNLSFVKRMKHEYTPAHLAWEYIWHLAPLLLVSLPNDIWETSAEIPYWWRVTT